MPPNAQQSRTYAAAHFALELDGGGEQVGLFRSLEGGALKTDVMSYQFGGGYDRFRQLGKPKFDDIKVQTGMSMSSSFWKWVSEFVAGKGARKNGAIVAADFSYNERARREFTAALIREMTFPKLDAKDKNPAYMGITMAVEGIEFKPGGGRRLSTTGSLDSQKNWTANNFRFRLDGFEKACARCTKVDGFSIKQNIAEYHMGGHRSAVKTPTQMDFPQISFYVPEADAKPFYDHFQKRGVRGEVPGRLNGTLECFDNEKRDTFRMQFVGADIVSVTAEKSDADSTEIKLVKVEVYTEKMTFEYLKV
jgi:phage tail-like protein